MIVKNEENHLPGCLESVKDIVDEIVVVDTGSEDSTIDIAEKYGAAVHEFKWCNDFSKARNYALSKSKSEWILYLDADERLDENSIDTVKALIQRKDPIGIRCKVYSKDEVNNKPKVQRYTRLFRNLENIRFTGRVHEQIDPSLIENDYKIINSEILINHIGYNVKKSVLKEKAGRNLRLLLDEYEENDTGYNAYQIANSYSILGDKDNAFKFFKLSLTDKDLPNEYAATSLNNIAEYYYRLGNSNKAASFIEMAIEKDPHNVLTSLVASDIYLSLDEGEKAANYCIQAYNANETKGEKDRLIDVLLAPDKIIYQGLYVAFRKNQVKAIDFFFTKLMELKKHNLREWDIESDVINMLSNNTPLTQVDISNFVSIVNDFNYEFYFALIDVYYHKEIIVQFFEKLVQTNPQNTLYRNKYVFYLSQFGKNAQALAQLEEKLELFPEDPTTIFYMISLYMETKEFEKLEQIIRWGKDKFKGNEVFISRINEIEKKIYPYLLQNQLN